MVDAKYCPRCKRTKPAKDFGANALLKDGLTFYCSDCQRAMGRQYRASNPERVRAWYRNYINNYRHTPAGRLQKLRSRAKQDGIEVNLNKGEFIDWFNSQPSTCYYCGRQFSNGNRHDLRIITIDRTDNDKPYMMGNIVLACSRCNFVKGSWFTEQQMLEIANKYFKKQVPQE